MWGGGLVLLSLSTEHLLCPNDTEAGYTDMWPPYHRVSYLVTHGRRKGVFKGKGGCHFKCVFFLVRA